VLQPSDSLTDLSDPFLCKLVTVKNWLPEESPYQTVLEGLLLNDDLLQ
jgi:hypothetical protein